ncbi:hypothetical protein BVC93_09690 [Mycobacterium sp. MS1601]|uniref:LLM class flavin-dependent oxidoreductase n=1 Tax=Mycobacterium sp. MS1601 TaxID=1936029 RepID=UPI0009790ECF|nr:LLM class flavin-dependent oxidoreductase [Mycobacterium sp. MS1601]AQA02661.1 hypothetical protein BVC93_09690 [Mycobacterium sp. MS1601]
MMQIGLGVFTGEVLPEQEISQTRQLRDEIEQMRTAEQVGLDAVWISEHHFLDNGYVGSVLPYAAAVAQATESITVGISVALAPLYDPIRLAEDTAFLDQLSGGRAALGVALGYRDIEYQGFGTTRSRRVRQMEDLCLLLRRAWADGPIDFEGTTYSRNGFEVFPKPVQPGGVPLLMGGHAPAAIERAARLADGFIMDGGTDSRKFKELGHNRDLFSRVAELVGEYRAALDNAGKDPLAAPVYLTLGGFLHEDGADAAWQTVQDGYMYTRRVYGDWYGLPPAEYADWYPDRMPPEEHAARRSEIWLGSPDELAPGFRRLRDVVGDSLHVMFRCRYPGISHEDTVKSIRLLGQVRQEVLA